MTDIRVKSNFTLIAVTMDWVMTQTNTLDERDELATSARVALGTDAMAASTDVLPDPDSNDRRGWWADYEADIIWGGWPIGCKCWLLERAKITDQNASEGPTLERAREYVIQALTPFLTKRVISRIDAQATQTALSKIVVEAQLYRGSEQEIDMRYQQLWQEPPVYDGPLIVPPKGIRIRVPYRNLTLSTTSIARRFVPITGQLVISKGPPASTWTTQPILLSPPAANASLSPTPPTRAP